MILTIGNTKGGVGKTTIALNIAIARAMSGVNIWLVDGDIQQTSQLAISIRNDNQAEPVIACSSFTDGKILRSQVKKQSVNFDDVIIDVGGKDTSTLRASMLISDVLLIPFQPRSFDVWAIDDIVALIKEVNELRDNLKCYAFLNNADVNSKDNEEAKELVSNFVDIKYIDTPICRRKSFANSLSQGLSILEYKPKDTKAINEFVKLYNLIYK